MPKFTFISNSENETTDLGERIGSALEPGSVIGLNGTLGSGKTRLTQAIGKSLEIPDGQIVSPTFTICVPHEGTLGLLHLDAYRINDPSEVDELGLDELQENGVVLIVEWAERIADLLPPIDLTISIQATGETERKFEFESHTALGESILKATQRVT